MDLIKRIIITIALCLTALSLIQAETQVSISASDNLAAIGDRIHLKILVKTNTDVDTIKVTTTEEKAFEILDQKPTIQSKQKEYMIFEKNIQVAFFKVGDFNVGPFNVDLLKDKVVKDSRETNSIPVTVKTVLKEEDKDIKPLKDLIELKGNPFYILKYVLLALLILGLIITIIMVILHYRNKPPVIEAPKLSPLEELEKGILHLNAQQLADKGKIKFHFLQLTQILKHFLHRTYGFNAEDLTTYETMRTLQKQESASIVINNLQFLFDTADLVKFAKFMPDTDVMDEIMGKIEEMIMLYKERIAEEERRQQQQEAAK